MIVRWFIHASVVSYVQNNNVLASIKTVEHVASLRQELICAARDIAYDCGYDATIAYNVEGLWNMLTLGNSQLQTL